MANSISALTLTLHKSGHAWSGEKLKEGDASKISKVSEYVLQGQDWLFGSVAKITYNPVLKFEHEVFPTELIDCPVVIFSQK